MVEQPLAFSKSKRYDRQLRIWGAHGQDALEAAQICLLNSGPTGTETLKSLVLGGIAGFTVVDDVKVSERDLGNNFFVDVDSLGNGRAQTVTNLLKELKENVEGSYVEDAPDNLIQNNPDFFKQFTLVIATQLPEHTAVKLERICRSAGMPLLLVRSYGLVGYMRISMREHCVIESKPENSIEDLRVACPWPDLRHYAHSIKLETLDDVHHKHVPYVVLLIQAADAWKFSHDEQLPSGYEQQKEFKQRIRSMQRTKEGVALQEDNFNEAISNANKLWSSIQLSADVRHVLYDDQAHVNTASPPFWVMVAALRQFVEQEGKGWLPLEGSLPDMTATTSLYLALQDLYRKKADQDVAAVEQHTRKILEGLMRDPDEIPRKAIRLFCKNARNLRMLRYGSLEDECSPEKWHVEALKTALANEDSSSNAALYILLRATDEFLHRTNRFPGTFDSELEEDVFLLKGRATQILSAIGCSAGHVADDLVGEVVRYGAGEVHCVAAVMGGMAAQEAIKLITKQFVPLSGTLIYNGMASTTSVLSL